MMMINTKEALIDHFCCKSLPALFPTYFADFVVYLTKPLENNLYELIRVCNFDLSLREGKFKERTSFASFNDFEVQSYLTFKHDGLIGQSLTRN